MSDPEIRVVATYGYRVVQNTRPVIKLEGGGGGFIPSSYSDAGATALIIGMTYGGAAVGYLLSAVLMALFGGGT